jgi:membrane associated rhomboid family serine protease
MNVVTLVVLVTVVVSWQLMERRDKETWMLSPYAVKHGREVWRVLTHAFIHADWMHLAFNMFVLYEFGQTVEHDLGFLGWMGFPALYLAGIVGGAIPALRKHGDNPNYRSLGASGAVSAILLAFISLHPTRTLLLFFVVPVPAVLAGVLFFWYESRMQQRSTTRIAHDAHLGGALVGVLWVFALVPDSWPAFVASLQGLLQ